MIPFGLRLSKARSYKNIAVRQVHRARDGFNGMIY